MLNVQSSLAEVTVWGFDLAMERCAPLVEKENSFTGGWPRDSRGDFCPEMG